MFRDLITHITSPFFLSACSICVVVFAYAYLFISVLPYSGFMAIKLVDGVNEDNAGYYAGLINSSFMVGVTISSYFWGELADVYGRRTVLIICLTWSSIFSVLFGLSSSYYMAILWRFLLGIGAGLMGILRSLPTEISNGDQGLEVQCIALAISAYGACMLFAPGAGGFLADPVSQYPSLWVKSNESEDYSVARPHLHHFLSKYPFFLANAMGSILCLISVIFSMVCLRETLPNRRHPKHMVGDLLRVFRCSRPVYGNPDSSDRNPVSGLDDSSGRNAVSGLDKNKVHQHHEGTKMEKKPRYGAVQTNELKAFSESDSVELPEEMLELERNRMDRAIRDSVGGFHIASFGGSALAGSMRFRQQLSTSVARRVSRVSIEKQRLSLIPEARSESQYVFLLDEGKTDERTNENQRMSLISEAREESEFQLLADEGKNGEGINIVLGEATIALLWGSKSIRKHLLVYWFETFAIQAAEESFPLFLMSRRGGLGLSAVAIGTVLSITGGIVSRLEYFVYYYLVEKHGIHGSMRIGVMFMWPFIATIPFVLWLNTKGPTVLGFADNHQDSFKAGSTGVDNKNDSIVITEHEVNGSREEDGYYGELTWLALIYLVTLVTMSRVLSATFLASSILMLNRAVTPSHRATMNGFCTQGTALARTLAPPFAGMLVASCLSFEIFPVPWVGAVVMFFVLAGLGCFAMLAANYLNYYEGL